MPKIPMGAVLSHFASSLPATAVAIVSDGQSVSWDELDLAANQRANWLRHAGVKSGDFVAILLPNGVDFFASTFAVWKAGATPCPIPVNTPVTQLSEILDLLQPSAVLADEKHASVGRWEVLTGKVDLDLHSSEPPELFVAPSWKAILSGGSTGRPKIIVDQDPAVFDTDVPIRLQKPFGCVLNPGPLYHNAPFISSHQALFIGAKVISMSHFDAELALELIEKHQVDWVNFVPTMMHRISRLPPEVRRSYDLSSLATVFHMASPMPLWLKREWIDWLGPDRIWELYGGTERLGATVLSGVEWLQKPGSVGRPVPTCEIKVVRSDGHELPPGELGEIYFRPKSGPGTTYRYIGGKSAPIEGGWESLGDMGHVDEDGYLFLADRKSDMIIRGGANIYPAEIETALDEHPLIQSALVIGLPDDEFGERVHAIVQVATQDDVESIKRDIVTFLKSRLIGYKIPQTFEFAGTPLRDDAGKARRSEVRAERLGGSPTGEHTSNEWWVAREVCEFR